MASEDDRSRQESREHFRKGLGHLWRAARETAAGIRQELDRKDLGKSVTEAGREIGKAMTDVVERLSAELGKTQKRPDPPPPQKEKPKGPTKDDPGFTIMDDDDKNKPR